MRPPLLIIGNKNYSSWSLRPWLLMRQFGLPFEERRLALGSEQFRSEIGRWSPSGKVPVLHHDNLVIWDSLAICEYLNETLLDGAAWPTSRRARALARAASAEMHSSFQALRQQLPMNCARPVGQPRRGWDADCERDIQRVQALWNALLDLHADGDFLAGRFGIVDAMFAPVALRFHTYAVPCEARLCGWIQRIRSLPAMQQWIGEAEAERERIAHYESFD